MLVSLLTYVVMFLLIRPSLRHHGRAVADGALSGEDGEAGADRPFAGAVALSLLPFLAFYFAWKLLRQDALDYSSKTLDFAYSTVFQHHPLSAEVSAGVTAYLEMPGRQRPPPSVPTPRSCRTARRTSARRHGRRRRPAAVELRAPARAGRRRE